MFDGPGSTISEYWPVNGRSLTSQSPPFLLKEPLAPTCRPMGSRSWSPTGSLKVVAVKAKLTASPSKAVNKTFALFPGLITATVGGDSSVSDVFSTDSKRGSSTG